jgi:hypothetical protein
VNPADAPTFPNGDAGRETLDDIKPDMAKSKADTNLIIEALKQAYVLVGTVTVAINAPDGFVIVRNAEDMAESWRMILDNDAKLRRRMKSLIQGSGWGTVITAHVPVVIAILNNHKGSFEHLVKRRDTANQSAHTSA